MNEEDFQQMKTDIALLNQRMEVVHEIKDTVIGNKEQLIKLNGVKKDLKEHVISDRWGFGIVIFVMVGCFVKIVFF